MKDFNFKTQIDTDTDVVEKMRKKINRQHQIYSIFFSLLLISVVAYILYRVVIETFDGYMACRNNPIHMIDDVNVIELNVRQGEKVSKGDTLFSYILTNRLLDVINSSKLTDVDQESIKTYNKIQEYQAELRRLEAKRKDVSEYIEKEKSKVAFGISVISNVEKRQEDLADINLQISKLKELIKDTKNTEITLFSNVKQIDLKSLPSTYTNEFIQQNKHLFGDAIQYYVASTNCLIVNTLVSDGELVYKKDPVMYTYTYDNLEQSDFHAILLSPPSFLDEFEDGDKVWLYSGHKLLDSAIVTLKAAYIVDVTEDKLSGFTTGREAVAVRLEFRNPDSIDEKYHINKLPIKIKYRRTSILGDVVTSIQSKLSVLLNF